MEGFSHAKYDKVQSNDNSRLQDHIIPLTVKPSESELYFLELLDPEDNRDFWNDVKEKCNQSKAVGQNMSQEQAIDDVRADNITEHCTKSDKDPVVAMMTEWYDMYEKTVSCKDLYPGFEKQISKIAIIIINREYKRVHEYNKSAEDIDDVVRCKYSSEFTVSKNPLLKRTILQLAAEGFKPKEFDYISKTKDKTSRQPLVPKIQFRAHIHRSYKRNFTAIAKCILVNDLRTWETKKDLPLELALRYRDDEISALLINSMELKAKVRNLFESRGKDDQKISFQEIIKDPNMKKTVIAVLDSMMHKDWPHQPASKNDGEEKLHIITDDPIRYHFHYRILDSDEKGRPAKLSLVSREESIPGLQFTEKREYRDNKDFDHRSISCLQALCQSDHKKAINHPTVRGLARRKWDLYGRWRIRLYAFNYAVFLAFLTSALLLAVVSNDTNRYASSTEKFRGFCEICTILISCLYLLLEIDQLNKEGFWLYIGDPFNWFDVGGILTILILVPLRFTGSGFEWILATIAFVLNFFRIYKYFPAWKSLGIYSTTLSILIKKDLVIFAVLYFIVLVTFSGATILSLRGVPAHGATSAFGAADIRGLGEVFLRGIKALAQSTAFTADYRSYNAFSVVVILASMFVTMIFLVNILIAQLNYSFGEACAKATEQYDVDKALFAARLDDTRFRWRNPRIKYYVDGSYENDKKKIQELMSKWDLLHSSMEKL